MAVKHNRWMTILSVILTAIANFFANLKLPSSEDETSDSADSASAAE